MKQTILVISGKVVRSSGKVDWPDLNYPGSGQTILRVLYNINYNDLEFQLDGPEGPKFNSTNTPDGVGFYTQV